MNADRTRISKNMSVLNGAKTKTPRAWVVFLWFNLLFVLALLYSAIFLLQPTFHSVCDSKDPKALKVLFIGNSLTFSNDLPVVFQHLAHLNQPQRPLKIGQVTYPDITLGQQWEKGVAQKAITNKGPWDFVILQDHSYQPIRRPAGFKSYALAFAKQIRNAGATPVLFMTWADEDDNSQQEISKLYRQSALDLHCKLAPIGDVWFTVRTLHPELALYIADHHHPAPAGTYLAACVLYNTISAGALDPATVMSGAKQDAPPIPLQQALTIENLCNEQMQDQRD